MKPTVIIPLSVSDYAALDNALRAHRGSAQFAPGSPSPMDAFQGDLSDAAQRLGFVPPEPGNFWVNIRPGDCYLLCWVPSATVGQSLN